MNQINSGAILSYLSILISLLISLLFTPLLIRLLGQSEFGLYSMIGSISAYLSVLDLGLGNAIVRFISRNRAIGDKESEARLNSLFLFLYTIIGILTIIIGVILYKNVEYIFSNSFTPVELQKSKTMIIILIINFSVSFPLSIFGSIMLAYEKFIVVKTASIVRTIILPVLTIPLLLTGFGSIMLVLVSTIINISILLFNVYYCFRKLNIKIKFSYCKNDYQLIKEIISYSFFIFLAIIVDQINWNTGQIILGAVTGTISVAVYAIALQFAKIYLRFSTALSEMFLPRVSMMVAKNASNYELTKMMIKFGRIQYIILAYILTGFVLFGKQFIEIWAGSSFSSAYYMTLIIMIPITIPLIQNFGISILQAKNLQGFRSVVLIIIAVLNVTISIPLAKYFNGMGVSLGTGFSYVIGNGIIMNIYYHRKIKLDILQFWKNIIFLTIPVVISLIIGFIINKLFLLDALYSIFFGVIFYSFFYFLIMWVFGFNEDERKLLIRFIKFLKNKIIKM